MRWAGQLFMPLPLQERLANGLTTVVIPIPSSHQVLVSLMVRTGSRFEPAERAGISHFVEHVLFRGNEAYPESRALFEAFEETGDILNAQTGVETTEFYQVVHPGKLERFLSRLAEFVRRPIFSDVEKERRIILDEMLYDYNEQGHLVRLDTLAAESLWGENPLAQSVSGTRDTVAAITREDLRTHFQEQYFPANMVLTIAGRVDGDKALRAVQRAFGDWNHERTERAPLLPPTKLGPFSGPAIRTVSDADNQFRLLLSFPAVGYRDPEEIPMALMCGVLDGGPTTRLQRVIREELALVYQIGAGYTSYHDVGQVDVSTTVSPQRLIELLVELLRLLRSFREEGGHSLELDAAKRRYRHALEFGHDSLDTYVDRHGWPLLFDAVRSEEEERALMEAVTAERIGSVAAELLAPERLHLVLVGPIDEGMDQQVRDAVAEY